MAEKRISVIVGNGFDLSMLQKLSSERNTSYEMFYYYYFYRKNGDISNYIIERMNDNIGKTSNWSDIEYALNSKIIETTDRDSLDVLKKDLREVQRYFSLYLNEIIDGELITRFSKMCEESEKPLASFSDFLGDLSEGQYGKMSFYRSIYNNDKIVFDFYNLNYTALLDNYIFLSSEKFDPERFSTSNNNFRLNLDPNGYGGQYKYNDPLVNLLINIYHPHGSQDVPASLLFGIEGNNINKNSINAYSPEKSFVKSVWARNDARYGQNLDSTELFIVFGSSMGETDNWWWRKIISALTNDTAELIIYNYCGDNADSGEDLVERFIENAHVEDADIGLVKDRTFVVNYGPNTNTKVKFLQL